jgi:hypothetical protein
VKIRTVWKCVMIMSSVLLKSATQTEPDTSGIIAGVCIIRSGRGSDPILNPHKDVLLPYNFGYARCIGYLTINWGISVCLSVCLCVRLYVSTVLNGSSPNLEGTFYGP